MGWRDLWRLATGALLAHRLRSALTMLGIVIAVASVTLLTSLGEGARQYIVSEVSQFGTNLLEVHRGKITTSGIAGAVGATVRKLTIEDSEALRRVPGVIKVLPVAFGSARVEAGERGRDVFVYGVTSEVPAVWRFAVGQGRFLPAGDPRRQAPVAVLGPRLKREIFGGSNALGGHVRIGGRRFRVIGVLRSKGQFLGFDLDDAAYIPVASAQSLFHRDDLMEIDVLFSSSSRPSEVKEGVRRVLKARHDGEEDFTVRTQTEMLDVLDRILRVVGLAIGGIGGISLLVGAIGILTMMWISVHERTAEVGLAKAIGATRSQILRLFLLEAGLLSVAGAAIGVALASGMAWLLSLAVPGLPLRISLPFVILALGGSLLIGLVSGVLPARRAASLDPLEALRAD